MGNKLELVPGNGVPVISSESSQPRSQGLSSPHPKGSEGRKTLVQARVLVTNLSSRKGSQFIKVLSPRPFVTS